MTRFKLANRKSYSAPYIIINDCFDEIDISNEFDVNMDDDEDDEENEAHLF